MRILGFVLVGGIALAVAAQMRQTPQPDTPAHRAKALPRLVAPAIPARPAEPATAAAVARRFVAAYAAWRQGQRDRRIREVLRATASRDLWATLQRDRSPSPDGADARQVTRAAELLRHAPRPAIVLHRAADGWRVSSVAN